MSFIPLMQAVQARFAPNLGQADPVVRFEPPRLRLGSTPVLVDTSNNDDSAADTEPEQDHFVPTAPRTWTEAEHEAELAAAEARGRAQGVAELSARHAVEKQLLIDAADAIEQAQVRWEHSLQSAVGEVLRSAIGALAGDPEVVSRALSTRISDISRALVGDREVALSVHPSQVEFARQSLGDRRGWSISADPTIDAGGCVARSGGAIIDATLFAVRTAIEAELVSWGCGERDAAK
jgi:flagellar biosynthesis/type III secretory pathway protein FliH